MKLESSLERQTGCDCKHSVNLGADTMPYMRSNSLKFLMAFAISVGEALVLSTTSDTIFFSDGQFLRNASRSSDSDIRPGLLLFMFT